MSYAAKLNAILAQFVLSSWLTAIDSGAFCYYQDLTELFIKYQIPADLLTAGYCASPSTIARCHAGTALVDGVTAPLVLLRLWLWYYSPAGTDLGYGATRTINHRATG
eukprot:1079397-Rhodomonas_salina.3